MFNWKSVALAAVLTLPAISFAGPTSISLLGDKDCFGTGGACAEDGSWVPTLWGGISHSGTDPVFTDRLISTSATTSWTHTFASGTYSDASLTFLTAGIADIYGPYDVYVDGIKVGEMPFDGSGHILAETFSFSFDAALLSDGFAEVSFTSVGGDAWAIDYSEITAMSTVTEPGLMLVLGVGLAGLGLQRNRRSKVSFF